MWHSYKLFIFKLCRWDWSDSASIPRPGRVNAMSPRFISHFPDLADYIFVKINPEYDFSLPDLGIAIQAVTATKGCGVVDTCATGEISSSTEGCRRSTTEVFTQALTHCKKIPSAFTFIECLLRQMLCVPQDYYPSFLSHSLFSRICGFRTKWNWTIK